MRRLSPSALLLVVAGCSDYDFASGKGADPGDTDNYTYIYTGDTAGDSGGDTADTPPADTSGPDACYEPEDGYTANPAARIVTTDDVTPVTVTFVSSDSSYDDTLYLDAPATTLLVNAWADAPGTLSTLGPFPAESELIFGITIQDTGEHWQSGPASRNADGVEHIAVTYEGGCSWLIGFEDLTGGGDLDYNDVVLRVQGMLRQDG